MVSRVIIFVLLTIGFTLSNCAELLRFSYCLAGADSIAVFYCSVVR